MESQYLVAQLSQSGLQGTHFYYDVCAESPDRRHVVFFEFEDDVPGYGYVTVAERDGSTPRRVSERLHAVTHEGVRQQWLDSNTVAYSQPNSGTTSLISLADLERCEMMGSLRMYSLQNGLGLTTLLPQSGNNLDSTVAVMDFQQQKVRPLFSLEDALCKHPLGTDFEGVEHVKLYHTKWSPSGTRFLFLISNKNKLSGHLTGRVLSGERIHSIFIADADGANLRYVAEEDHHCVWGADDEHLCYFKRNEDGSQDFISFPLDGSSPYPLLERMRGKHTTLNRAGTKVLTDVTHCPSQGEAEIWLYDVESELPETLMRFSSPDFSQRGVHVHPAFSRDEKRVYFNAAENGFRSFYAVDYA
jgi:hypothetical protein